MADPIEVPFSDNESEEVTDDQLIVEADKPGDSPEVKAQRAQRRRERAAERERERKEQADRLARVEAELAQERAERARLAGYVQALPTAQQNGKDPYEAALDQVYEERANAYAQMNAELKAGTLDEKRSKHYERVSRDIEGRISGIHAQRAVDASVQRTRQESAQQPYVHKYPDVYSNPAAFEYAKAEHAKRAARARVTGEQITNDTVDEIMEETRSVFKLGPKKGPSKTDRERLSGYGSGYGDGYGDNRAGIAMTPALRKMAIALNPDLKEEDAIKKWVDTAGKELRKQKVL